MINPPNRIEVVTSVQRRRRWTASEKVRMDEETFGPGMTVSLVARQHGVAPNQLFTWRRLVAQGSLTAAGSGEEVVPASDYRALQNQIRELHRLLGKKTLEGEILKEALEYATGSKKRLRLPPKDDTRFTRTRLSVIVHPVSSLQLTKGLDRVQSFGGHNRSSM
jgi:transposase